MRHYLKQSGSKPADCLRTGVTLEHRNVPNLLTDYIGQLRLLPFRRFETLRSSSNENYLARYMIGII